MTTPIMEFIDLQKQYGLLAPSIARRMQAVLDHGKYIMGPEVGQLEKQLASFTGSSHCVSCASGTDALLMILMARGIGPGDAVFTTPFTFIATAEVISLLGATPVYVDIDPRTYNIDPERLAAAIADLEAGRKPSPGSPSGLTPKAVIPVDMFGLPADYDAIEAVAKKHGLFVLEDAAQSLGGSYKGRPVGSLGDAAATSFFPAKPLGCYGDGGAIFTDDGALTAVLESIRVHGKGSDKYDNVRIGMNGRLDTLQAAILLSKLEVFAEEIQKRQAVALRYSEGLRDSVVVPHVPEGLVSAWAQYSVRSPRRDAVMQALKDAGIPSVVYYPKPLHQQTAFAPLKYGDGAFPVSESTASEIFSLPMHPYLEAADQDRVIQAVRGALA
jgi:UDP-2-acetamido-2-deoxy-ribo-hexuluronate aminotransferase